MSAGGDASGARGQRYGYLVQRLQNRQITMEEATELFALMQGMIARANEAARAAARTVGPPPPPASPLAPARGERLAPASGAADDFLLVGLLAMGAGAGLLAALSKRIGDTSPPSPSGGGRSKPSEPSQKG